MSTNKGRETRSVSNDITDQEICDLIKQLEEEQSDYNFKDEIHPDGEDQYLNMVAINLYIEKMNEMQRAYLESIRWYNEEDDL